MIPDFVEGRKYGYAEEWKRIQAQFPKSSWDKLPLDAIRALNQRIHSAVGQLLVLEHIYFHENRIDGFLASSLSKQTYVGRVEKGTFVPNYESIAGVEHPWEFVTGLEGACSLDCMGNLHNYRRDSFVCPPDLACAPLDLYFMNEPVGFWEFKTDVKGLGTKPRLTFHIGNASAVQALESIVANSWQYDLIGDSLGCEMPASDLFKHKRIQEQYDLVKRFLKVKAALTQSRRRLKQNLDYVGRADREDIHDEVSVTLSPDNNVPELTEECLRLLETARDRNYSRHGVVVGDDGILINVATFFEKAIKEFRVGT